VPLPTVRHVLALSFGLGLSALAVGANDDTHGDSRDQKLKRVQHFVVIYQENHSFDNLYGGWEGVRGRQAADAAHTLQVSEAGVPYGCLLQNDANLTSPPLAKSCSDAANGVQSAFVNAPFSIDTYIPASASTCLNGTPGGAPGGCTRDLVHRFYQEQYQLNGGAQNRYVTGSDAIGLTMGYYDTQALPVYEYLHRAHHPHYAIADNFFQGVFGGSFLNHQWLIAAAAPAFAGAVHDGSSADLHSVVDTNGMPNKYALYTPTAAVKDSQLTVACPAGVKPPGNGLACGDYAVNTTQPPYQPYTPTSAKATRLPPLANPTIGDRLSSAGVDWGWYSGGWSNANGDVGAPGWTNDGAGSSCSDPATIGGAVYPNCPNSLFQFHHQPFNYFAAYAPGTAARAAHLRDEDEFLALAQSSRKDCKLKPVSFVKPIGAENEHPGYASESNGSVHLVQLLQAIEQSACARDTLVIVTYDEFGGQWDHVPPPGQGSARGAHDQFGPGTRIPALIVSPWLSGDFVVDHTSYDTTSILATLERRYGLRPLGTRDAQVADLGAVFEAKEVHAGTAGGD